MGSAPFSRLLIPVVLAIVIQYYCPFGNNIILLIMTLGILFMLSSFFTVRTDDYKLRWVFGTGIFLFLFGFASLSFYINENSLTYDFSEEETIYRGVITELPEKKPRTILCIVKLDEKQNRKILCYFANSEKALNLKAGDGVIFKSRMQPIRNRGNPDDFDYTLFMKSKRIVASSYIPQDRWHTFEYKKPSIRIYAQKIRRKALKLLYDTPLKSEHKAFLATVTLGERSELSEDIKESFRASGTAHVLAVSGLHVGIIYVLISFALSFLGKGRVSLCIKQIIIIISIWAFALISGLSLSTIRAAIMITIYCIGQLINRSPFSFNTLFIAAFFMLLINPLSIFSIGFQASFSSVFSILYFQPKLAPLLKPRFMVTKYIWTLFVVSLSAQLGVFPLFLYYFGTFPVYFFISNIIIIPLIGICIYTYIASVIIFWLSIHIEWLVYASKIIFNLLQIIINIIFNTTHLVESLPYSQIKGVEISLIQMFAIYGIVLSTSIFIKTKRAKHIIMSLTSILLLIIAGESHLLKQQQDILYIFNQAYSSPMEIHSNRKRKPLEITENSAIQYYDIKIVKLTNNTFNKKKSETKFDVDYLILSNDSTFSLYVLQRFFNINRELIIDSSVPRRTANRLEGEAEKLNQPVHDTSKNGAFKIFFTTFDVSY